MAICWYAIQTALPNKEKIKAALIEHGFSKELKKIKSILTFDYEAQALWVEPGNSLLNGYALIQFDNKNLDLVTQILVKAEVGHFLNTEKGKTPRPVPNQEVKEFRKGVKTKKKSYGIGDEVLITDGLFSGLDGIIKTKNKLMAKVEIQLPHRSASKWISILSLKLKSE